jgi:hypothetical protein
LQAYSSKKPISLDHGRLAHLTSGRG